MHITLFLLSLFLAAPPAQAATCNDLTGCAKAMFDVTGQRYLWDAGTERKIMATPDVELTKANAEIVFTAMLDQVGLARVPVGDGKTFRIVPSPLRKEMDIPMVEASATVAPKLPETWDWVQLRYRARSGDLAVHMEQMYRLHVPREARINADYNTGIVIVEGPAPLARRMYQTLKAADVPMTPAVKAHLKAEREARLKREAARSATNN